MKVSQFGFFTKHMLKELVLICDNCEILHRLKRGPRQLLVDIVRFNSSRIAVNLTIRLTIIVTLSFFFLDQSFFFVISEFDGGVEISSFCFRYEEFSNIYGSGRLVNDSISLSCWS